MHVTTFRVLAIVFFLILGYNDAFPSTSCKIPNSNGGTCTAVSKCDPLNELHVKKTRTPDEDTYYRQSVASCSSRGSKVAVCCPPESKWSNLSLRPVEFPKNASTTPQKQEHTAADNNELKDGAASEDPIATFYSNLEEFGQTPEMCGNGSSSDRIVGGNATGYDEYPWLALLEYAPNKYSCGGSLISRSHVLTAAHCLYNPPTKVRLSEYNLLTDPDEVELDGGGYVTIYKVTVDVENTFSHENHDFRTAIHDIGIVKLKEKVDFGRYIKPICLPTAEYVDTDFTKDTKFVVAGWGSDNEYINTALKKAVYLPYIPISECMDILGNSDVKKDEHICAGGEKDKDSCAGDSGGPLMYKDPSNNKMVLVGVVSNGGVKCGDEGEPGIYMFVYNYVDWIYSIMIKHK